MHCLFLDLASHNGLIACVTGNKTVASHPVDHRVGDHELLPRIESMLKEAGWSYPDLTHVACVTGPGGFTSLRVAVTCANVLADQLGIPSAGVHLSDVYGARLGHEKRDMRHEYWFHSTKKEQLFIRGGEWAEPSLVMVEDLLKTLPKKITWCGELIDEHRQAITGVAEMMEALLRPYSEVLPAFLSGAVFAKKQLEPWYGRGW
ncbi:tRNA (adenosine(37)-N6)-threonylcarbamoyltransferase complex dimerization subunit type 1 TsaB [Candidatus Peregrinibacteria bacterium]|nr:tRNA (adenosine(37)-N6)-threonylcarbamoyltransferase complex dimerization subunit type 1 TsaB [Candidatus Peregrinibacteria bacterium]